ncbi:hypothetical protein Syun_018071 [Stephania yunnanensis]|uniref:Pentatricopeptide repeat-containing protein n=1 Tax=Stephania yunnanensis TaxID=152371 RepID=A0AAP0IRQ4_9MAGN
MIFTFNHLITLYSKHGLLTQSHQLFDEMPQRNVFTWNAIIQANIKNQALSQARIFFDAAPTKDSVTYNSMIAGYANAPGFASQAFGLLREMLATHIPLHSYMVKSGNDSSGFAASSLIDMYSKCRCFQDALRVFVASREINDLVAWNAMIAACCREGEMEMAYELFSRSTEANDVVSWNTMISGYARHGYLEEGLELFVQMREKGIEWNEHTLAGVLSACSSFKSQKHGKQIHAWVLKNGLNSNSYINSGIVEMYCKCDNIRYAELVNEATGAESVFSITPLIVAYSSQGNIVDARKLFDSLKEKNSVAWTALFSGYVGLQQCEAVFELYREFCVSEATVPDVPIFMNLLGACSIQASLNHGKQVHSHILRMGIEIDKKLTSSMVDMYAKCGEINYAEKVFERVHDRDRVLYNTMVAGYAHNGYEVKAIGLFEEMMKSNIRPDEVTFIAVLSACRHAGLMELGDKYFDSMTEDYGLVPEIDHYSCMVDLYGRANNLRKAVEFMKKIPMELDAVILGALLNACKMNGNMELAKETENKLLKIEADNGARYVQLANAYAAKGDWAEMSRIRRKMRGEKFESSPVVVGFMWTTELVY